MNNSEDMKTRAARLGIAAVIPAYNNAATVTDVVLRAARVIPVVIVVDDGSTDDTRQALAALPAGIEVISYPNNRGKGEALLRGFDAVRARGMRYALTIDADGQHTPEDAECFIARAEAEESQGRTDTLIIGARGLVQQNMPARNTFANRFSNFWFHLETGRRLDDTQSGFRLYPLEPLRAMRFATRRYEFELEVAVRLAWRGYEVVNIPINVYYPPAAERVSHFRPVRDFVRISLLNSVLVVAAALWYYPMKFVRWLSWSNIKEFVRHNLTHTAESNARVSAALGLGVFWGIAPVWGYQMILAGVTAHVLRLNKIVTVASSNISIPPMIPLIIWGSFAVGGLVTGRSVSFIPSEISYASLAGSVGQYIAGSVALAVVAGLTTWLVSWIVLKLFRREPRR